MNDIEWTRLKMIKYSNVLQSIVFFLIVKNNCFDIVKK